MLLRRPTPTPTPTPTLRRTAGLMHGGNASSVLRLAAGNAVAVAPPRPSAPRPAVLSSLRQRPRQLALFGPGGFVGA